MSNEITTTGFKIEVSDGAETPAFIEIENATMVPTLGGEAPEIDVTNLKSVQREYLLGISDPGTASVECNYNQKATPESVITDLPTGQSECLKLYKSAEKRMFRCTFSDGLVAQAEGLVKMWQLSGGVDEAVKLTITIRWSGEVAYDPA